MDFFKLQKDIQERKFQPVYFLWGPEPYFIDKLSRQLEKGVLNPTEATFNKKVLYGPEATFGSLISELKSYPMMAKNRLVVLKEAQKMRKPEFEKLAQYLEKPVPSSIFVISYQGKLDGRSKLSKILKKNSVFFESKKLYDNQIPPFIRTHVKQEGFEIDDQAVQVLLSYLGTNPGLIESELQKLFINLKASDTKRIEKGLVFEMINVDKEFNVFELINALGQRNSFKCHQIISHMMKNLKDNPPILIINQLFQFYSKLGILKSLRVNNTAGIAQTLHIPQFVAGQYVTALRNIANQQVVANLNHILECDLYLKGIKPTHMGQDHIMKTLIYRLLN